MVICVYLLIPLTNISFFLYIWFKPTIDNKDSVYESWFFVYFIINLARILSFFTSIKNTFLKEALNFNEIRILIQDMPASAITQLKLKTEKESVKELKKSSSVNLWRSLLLDQLQSADQYTPYIHQKRKYGEGDIRIGQCLVLDDDIYSFTFMTLMKETFIHKSINILTG